MFSSTIMQFGPQLLINFLAEYALHKQQDTLHMLSLHYIENSFIDLPFGDRQHGIFGCVPAEMLHISGNGIMQYMLESVNQIIGSGTDKKLTLHQLDTLHQNMVRDALSQSERDMPCMSDRNGITDGTKMSASKRVGNMFILLCAIHTHAGAELFCSGCTVCDVSLDDMKRCLKLQLGFEVWVNQSNSIDDVKKASLIVAQLIMLIKRAFPRQSGNGWCIPNLNSLAKMTHYMLQFGKAKKFCGQVGERVLKHVVKNHAQQTQRRVNVFATQCAERQFESAVYEYAYNDMDRMLNGIIVTTPNDTSHFAICKGKHTITFARLDNHGRGDVSVHWADKRNKIRTPLHEIVQYALRTHAHAHGWTEQFAVDAYTSAKVTLDTRDKPVLFYANIDLYGHKRHHFCMVEFTEGEGEDATHKQSPAEIVCFLKFVTPGFPTPCNNTSVTSAVESSIYCIIHSAKQYLSWELLQRNFIVPFTLGDPKKCVYIVDIQNICKPLFVFRNYGSACKQYFCALSFCQWGKYFKHKLR
jgi:hypothetical protein